MTSRRPNGVDLRGLQRDVAEAADAQVLAVLTLVDDLASRGVADTLLAPVRPRLRALRPRRKFTFLRLLALPLDGVIVDADQWRSGAPSLPRPALRVFGALVQACLPGLAAEIDALGAGAFFSDDALTRQAGAMLWPEAARVLESAVMPPAWLAAGLPPAAFRPLAEAFACILSARVQLMALDEPGDDADRLIAALLQAAAARGQLCGEMLLAVLLLSCPDSPVPLRTILARHHDAGTPAGRADIETAIRCMEAAAGGGGAGDPHATARALRRQVTLLEKLATDPASRMQSIPFRAALRERYRHRFTTGLDRCITQKLGPLPESGIDAFLDVMEHDARGLSQLAMEVLRLDPNCNYDASLRAAAEAVMARDDWELMDRVRLVEILAGSRAAIQAMSREAPRATRA
jgi:hypothetical protein